MSNNNNSNNQEHIVDSPLVPNEFLASERKQKGIDERDAADALKISVSRLRLIEAGDYKEFPSETYVRGHLRNYSRFLKLDEDAVVASYNASNPPSFDYVNPEKNIKTKSTGSKVKHTWLFLLLLSILITIWVVVHSLLDEARLSAVTSDVQSIPVENSSSVDLVAEGDAAIGTSTANTISSSGEVSNEQVLVDASQTVGDLTGEALESGANLNDTDVTDDVVTQQADELNTESNNELDASLVGENVESGSSVLPLNDISSQPDIVVSKVTAAELVKSVMNADENKSPEEAEVQASPTDNVLYFSFENPCWVEVVGANGEVIFAGLKPADSSLRVNGDSPFKIVLGNVDGTKLTYNGEAVALEPQRNGRPLRFVVGG